MRDIRLESCQSLPKSKTEDEKRGRLITCSPERIETREGRAWRASLSLLYVTSPILTCLCATPPNTKMNDRNRTSTALSALVPCHWTVCGNRLALGSRPALRSRTRRQPPAQARPSRRRGPPRTLSAPPAGGVSRRRRHRAPGAWSAQQ